MRLPNRARWLWLVVMLDMALVAWMMAAGDWFDETSRLTAVATLGGRHKLVLTLALLGFAMLAGLALVTDGFTHGNKVEVALLIAACLISVAALAGALSALLLLILGAVLLGFAARLLLLLLFRR